MHPLSSLQLRVRLDRSLVEKQGGTVRHLLVEVTAPPAPEERLEPARPLDLALVVDTSGSMGIFQSGVRLRAARQAALGIVDRLRETDRLAIVTFNSEAATLLPAIRLDPEGNAAARAALQELVSNYGTNLATGWLEGARALISGAEQRAAAGRRVLVLSDGMANKGLTDPERFEGMARELLAQGVATSTIGIGDDYSTRQLEVMAVHGGGRLHDAERPDEIVEVVLGELLEIDATVAENVTLHLDLPPYVRAKCLSGYATLFEGQSMACGIGSLVGNAFRDVVLALELPSGKIGEELHFIVQLRWNQPGSPGPKEGNRHEVVLTYASQRQFEAEPVDPDVLLRVAQVKQSAIMRRLVQLNREGRFEEARQVLLEELEALRSYCRGVAGAGVLVGQLEAALAVIDRPWKERARKEVELAHYRRSSSLSDHRSKLRPDWSTYLNGKPD